jgi:hypothetical protein
MAIWPNVRGQQVEVRDETTAITTIPSHTWPHYTSQCLHIFLKCPTIIARKGNKSGDIHVSLCSNMRAQIFLSKDLFVQDTGWKCTVSYSVSYRIIIRRRCAQPSHLLLREKSMKNVSSLLPPSICSLNLSPIQKLKEAQPIPGRMFSIVYTSFKIYPSFSTLSPLFYPSF